MSLFIEDHTTSLTSLTHPTTNHATNHAPSTLKSFAFWNVNAIRPRLLYNTAEITSFLNKYDPDILFLSELRMVADPRSQSTPSSADKKSRDEQNYWNQALNIGVFKKYKVAGLSLAR